MKHINTFLRKPATLLALILILGNAMPAMAQVRVPFTQRTAAESPTKKIYTIKGDFQMIGNTNLTLQNYGDNTSNSNNMIYVDIDGTTNNNTLNSSSATLALSTEAGAVPECSSIIYAGLYWLGRAHNGTSPNVFTVGGTTANYTSGTINGYTLTISSSEGTTQTATYTFTPATGSPVIFKLTTNDNEEITGLTVQTGASGTPTNLTSTRTANESSTGWFSSENYVEATLTNPYTVNTGNTSILVTNLRASTWNNAIDGTFRANVSFGGKVLDKSVVYLKHEDDTGYTKISATDIDFTDEIFYPITDNGYMYSAYAEVTQYVRDHGIGAYTVADMALTTGNDGEGTGKFGGWAMIVVYENSKMKWRDVTIFDGYAYINDEQNSNTMTYYELPVSGFKTAQNGTVTMKVGVVAGEGDRGVGGGTDVDNFSIRNYQDTQWILLSTDNNPTDNFFASSIVTDGVRNPNRYNNTGIDIVNIDVPTAALTNNQESTKFRYGTNQDTYIITCIAMAVDAFIPDLVPYIQVGEVNGAPYNPLTNAEVLPNGDIQYTLELSNPGNERILNAAINIPVPYTASFVNASAQYFLGTGDPNPQQPSYVVNGNSKSIQWNIGTIPMGGTNLLAKLTFTLKATNDCFLLVNEKCSPKVLVEGSVQGTGELSGTEFDNLRFVHGYKDAPCTGEPIIGPLSVEINATDFVNTNCNNTEPGYYIKVFDYCQKSGVTTLPFSEIEAAFPAGSTFWSTFKTVNQDGVDLIVGDGTQYTSTNSFPSTLGEHTFYALPPTVSTCYWEFKVLVESCNLWHGDESEDWGTAGNWTLNTIPNGATMNVEYATLDNYTAVAQRDLVLDIDRTIGNITNKSDKRLRIPATKTLVVDGEADTGVASKLIIEAAAGQANGALILNHPDRGNNANLQGTVEFVSKSKPGVGTWPRVWQYFGTPIKDILLSNAFGANVQGSIYGTPNNIIVRKYNEALNLSYSYQEKWEDLNPASHLMKPFEGYEITQPVENTKHSFAGPLVTTDKTVSLPISSNTAVYARGSFILANPYAAPIFFNNMANDDFVNLQKVIYIFNTGSRKQWEDANGESELGEQPGTYTSIPFYVAEEVGKTQIPSMQGFLVAADDLNQASSFTFRYETVYRPSTATTPNEPMLIQRAGNDKKPKNKPDKDAKPVITMDVIGENSSDRLYLIKADEATKAYDDGWDGFKFISPNVAQLYAFDQDGNRLQVNSDSDLNDTYIGFRSGGESSYKLRFRFTNLDGVYSTVFLEDLATRMTEIVTDGMILNFSPAAGSAEKRFRITVEAAKGKSTGLDNSKLIKIHVASKRIVVDNNTDENGMLTVYDVTGTPIFEKEFVPGRNDIMINLKKGSYIIEAKTASERTVVKSI